MLTYPQHNSSKLTQILSKYKNTPSFTWGTFDCAIWAMDILEELHGTIPGITKHRELTKKYPYKTKEEGKKFYKEFYDTDDLSEVPSLVLNVERKPISEVKHNDLVYWYVKNRKEGAFGFCNGKRAYFIQREGGAGPYPLYVCSYCWSIENG